MVATKGAPAMPWKETRTMDQRTEFALKSMKTSNFRELDRAVEALCEMKYPVTQRLRQIVAIGPVTALSFVLTIEDPELFENRGMWVPDVPRSLRSGRPASAEPHL
jgi:hypothetical protein